MISTFFPDAHPPSPQFPRFFSSANSTPIPNPTPTLIDEKKKKRKRGHARKSKIKVKSVFDPGCGEKFFWGEHFFLQRMGCEEVVLKTRRLRGTALASWEDFLKVGRRMGEEIRQAQVMAFGKLRYDAKMSCCLRRHCFVGGDTS